LLNQPLEACVYQLAIEGEIKRAILGEDNPFGRALKLAVAFERADWPRVLESASPRGSDLSGLYRDALRWAAQIFEQERAGGAG
jgi:EAL and modified HD-GYP domain-containing signal transduction protein